MAHEIVEEIAIAAPPERVFDAWTQARHMTVWWKNGAEFHTEHFENNLRVGGKWLVRFRVTDGTAVGAQGEYLRVERPNYLSFTWQADWDAGCATRIDMEFLPDAGGTLVKLRHSGFDEIGWRDANKKVWDETLDWLRCYLTKP